MLLKWSCAELFICSLSHVKSLSCMEAVRTSGAGSTLGFIRFYEEGKLTPRCIFRDDLVWTYDNQEKMSIQHNYFIKICFRIIDFVHKYVCDNKYKIYPYNRYSKILNMRPVVTTSWCQRSHRRCTDRVINSLSSKTLSSLLESSFISPMLWVALHWALCAQPGNYSYLAVNTGVTVIAR